MIYLNHAATTYPKPQGVLDALAAASQLPPVPQYRSGAELRRDADGDVFARCRRNLARIAGLRGREERIYLSSGATDSANRLLHGLFSDPDARYRIVTTETEHNSILRPLMNLPRFREGLCLVPCDRWGKVSMEALEAAVTEARADVVILNHCSNVTGAVQDLSAAAALAHRHGALCIADCAQSAGCIEIDAGEAEIDALIFTGHKSLFGPQGIGAYYVRSGLCLRPLLYGGTGRDSTRLVYEDPDSFEYEVGTQNGIGAAGLAAGTDYVLSLSIRQIRERERALMRQLYEGLGALRGVTVFGDPEVCEGPVLSFALEGMKPADTAFILASGYDITVRAGLHCAPLIHRRLGSAPDGTVRVSVSALTQPAEIAQFLDAVREISAAAESGR